MVGAFPEPAQLVAGRMLALQTQISRRAVSADVRSVYKHIFGDPAGALCTI